MLKWLGCNRYTGEKGLFRISWLRISFKSDWVRVGFRVDSLFHKRIIRLIELTKSSGVPDVMGNALATLEFFVEHKMAGNKILIEYKESGKQVDVTETLHPL